MLQTLQPTRGEHVVQKLDLVIVCNRFNCARDEIISENDGDVNANFEDAGLVLDKNVPVCSIQNVPEKWGCIDHLTYMYFFFQHKVVMGKTMEDWCRFSVCFWHTFRGTGMW